MNDADLVTDTIAILRADRPDALQHIRDLYAVKLLVPADPFAGWTPAAVGCHWTRGRYSASTIQTADRKRSGYALYCDRQLVAEFITWADVVKLANEGN